MPSPATSISLVIVVAPYYADSVRAQLTEHKLDNWLIGRVVEGSKEVSWAK